jgi:hypothetical protein
LPLLCPSDIVEELREKGVSEVSEGATCVFIAGKEVPLIVQKSDGGFGYASTDMAALKQRVTQEKADWIIYVTDVGQAGHFDLVFAAGRRVGWLPAADSNEVSKWAGWWACTVRTVCCFYGVPWPTCTGQQVPVMLALHPGQKQHLAAPVVTWLLCLAIPE